MADTARFGCGMIFSVGFYVVFSDGGWQQDFRVQERGRRGLPRLCEYSGCIWPKMVKINLRYKACNYGPFPTFPQTL